MGKLIDLTGQKFGEWTVLRRATKDEIKNKCRGTYWLCKCSCGNQVIVLGDSLRQNKSTKCKKCYSSQIADNLTGNKYNKLTVIRRATKEEKTYKNDGSAIWLCKCDCGNYTYVRAADLKSDGIKSCGCLLKETSRSKDITNQQFGKLTALEPTDKRRNGSIIWKCQCECGNIHYVAQNDLHSGGVISCGCVKSKGEATIKKILQDLNIEFISEKTFNDCIFPNTKAFAKFDFYLPDYKTIIEYDGVQHFAYNNAGWNNKEHFIYTKQHDRFKEDYCIKNGLYLIRIPYTDYNKLNCNYLLHLIKKEQIV